MIRRRRAASDLGGPDLTPLLDIIFIILVFLLLTANVRLLGLPVEVPSTDQPLAVARVETAPLEIGIVKGKPHLRLSGRSYAAWGEFERDLLAALAAQPRRPLVIAADQAAPVQPLVRLMALLQQKGIGNSQIVMESAPAG